MKLKDPKPLPTYGRGSCARRGITCDCEGLCQFPQYPSAPDLPAMGEVIDAFYYGLAAGLATTSVAFGLLWWAL